MIPLSVIQLFATTDETRYILTRPRIIDGKVVATDGRILVEVPESEVSIDELEVLDGNYPDYLKVLEPQIPVNPEPLALPELPKEPAKVTCCECRGSGEFVCNCPDCCEDHPCELCDGEGSYSDRSKWRLETPEIHLGGYYVAKAIQLPSLQWFKPAVEGGPAYFTFGNGGRGLLMPMRKEIA
jgi:hypothetical protein